MRRHHFLSLRDTDHDHPPDSINLLIGAEAHQKRRRSTQIPPSPAKEMHRRLHSVFGGTIPREGDSPDSAKTDASEDEEQEDATSPGFLGRVHSYSRLMHAHTKSQLARPDVSTVPSYKKTMHAFTRNQLESHRRASCTQRQSETSSPQLGRGAAGARLAVASKLHAELEKLVLDEVPPAPGNTPEIGGGGGAAGMGGDVGSEPHRGESHFHGIDFRKLRLQRRSITDPDMVRAAVSSGVRVRDFAA